MDAQQIGQALQYGWLQGFGLSMPMLAPDWSPQGAASPGFKVVDSTPDSSDQPIMTITSTAHWAAPLSSSFLNLTAGEPMPVTLVQAGGAVEQGPGVLLTVFDQEWLRLGRLYCEILETPDASRPERDQGLSCRPVPRYIFFPNVFAVSPHVTSGLAGAWDDLGFAGDARFYDGDGLQIDPIAVMAAFESILTRYPGLQSIALGSSPIDPIPLTNYLTGDSGLATDTVTRVRLVNPDGSAYTEDPTHITGLTQVDQASALYELTGSPGTVGIDAVDTNSFPQYQHDRLVFGPATNGRLTSSFTPPEPATSPNVSLARDYYTLRVVDLRYYINGKWPDASEDPATSVQRYATVRVNENASFLLNGNDVLGAIHAALESGSPPPSHHGSPGESDLTLAVAQAIDTTFPIPSMSGANAQWPGFPPGITVNAGATLSINLKNQVTLKANWVTTTQNTPTTGDVVLEIDNLPANAWVRVYPRLFLPNASATRGDGQGLGVPAGGAIVMYLSDPLTLRDPRTGFAVIPGAATLMFDMVVVLANSNSRIYGGLTVSIAAPLSSPPALTPNTGANPCGSATYQGVSNAGILGLGKAGKISPTPSGLIGWAEALTGNVVPRDAPRMPSMARRELLVAGAGSDPGSPSNAVSRTWTGVIGGGRIARETVCSQSRIGAPGGFGGRETTVVAAATHGSLLAYDIARHALRRTQDIIPRLIDLAGKNWNIPPEAEAVAVGHTPTADNGTMAGAVLQTIAPVCESPELNFIWSLDLTNQAVTNWITQNISTQDASVSQQIVQGIQNLQNLPTPPDPATETALTSTGSSLDQIAASANRMAIELERELTSGEYGRRDAQWALMSAIQTARHVIYIETPGFCTTAHPWNTSPPVSSPPLAPWSADLIAALQAQMAKMPGLRVIVCVNRNPDFATGYEGMASYEVSDRLAIVQSMPQAAASPPDSGQFILFHPIGFPGRYARVETNVVVIDDIWTMIGGATFRRRGLTFDGSSDLVLTDTLIENGRSAAIRDFRRGMMANRLGVPIDSSQPSYVALSEARTAFGLIADLLTNGGSGKMASVWDGTTPGLTPTPPLTADQANPDGRHFNELTAAVVALLGSTSGF